MTQFARGATVSGLLAALLSLPLLAAPVSDATLPDPASRSDDRATIFAPGEISGPGADIAPTFLPNGEALYFSRRIGGRLTVMSARRVGLTWTQVRVAPFSGQWTDLEATVSPRGDYLIFASDRPTSPDGVALRTHYYGQEQSGGHLWRVPLGLTGPSPVVPLPETVNGNTSVWTPSIAQNDDLYFMQTDETTGRFRLRRSIVRNGVYLASQPLNFSTGAANDVDPAVDGHERFLVFSSDRATSSPDADRAGPEHLFIAFQPASPRPLVCAIAIPGWTDAQESAVEPRFSPDEGLLYFASRHPDHAPGANKAGPWDDGAANIWVIRFTSRLWHRAPGASAACKAHEAD